jgi:aspartyl-tRNA(Asn)/glutamyl-tRNA(Gln) amidotransferase subunit B
VKYLPIIGLEIHTELTTKSKLFCRCPNRSSDLATPPNSAICPVCIGLPGALPVLNKAAVLSLVKLGKALHCHIPDSTKWDRKNYFYPDLPKGYQISQYDEPICRGGTVTWQDGDGMSHSVSLTRIHLEEDTGKLTHPEGADYSLIDYNRSSIPLIELVTEPTITSAVEAKQCSQEYQHILRDLGVSEADMEKGQMRCEANISLIPENLADKPEERLSGTKVEIKNLNSFRSLERAIIYEIKRQTELLTNGERILQQTRGWNETKGETYVMREKETSEDYRYFPEPDLGRLDLVRFQKEIGDVGLSRHHLLEKLQKSNVKAEFITTVLADPVRCAFLESLLPAITPDIYSIAAQWISQEPSITQFIPEEVAKALAKIKNGSLRPSLFKEALLATDANSLQERIQSREQTDTIHDLESIVKNVLEHHSVDVIRYRQGQKQLIGFFIGLIRQELQGQGDPVAIQRELRRQLEL